MSRAHICMTGAILSLPERDCFFTTQKGSRKDRKQFAMEMKYCVQACVTLSNYMDYINIVMVGLLCNNHILQTVLSGDTSLIVWRQLGDLVNSSTALGLHGQHDDDDDDEKLTFLTHMRRQLFTVVFNLDKSASLMTGRPPALSCRYIRFQLPMDVDLELWQEGEEAVERALQALDQNGVSTY